MNEFNDWLQNSGDEFVLQLGGVPQSVVDEIHAVADTHGLHHVHYKYSTHEVLYICKQEIIRRRMFHIMMDKVREEMYAER